MGQKAHPFAVRLGINTTWRSQWIAPKGLYAKYLLQDEKIRTILKKKYGKEGAIAETIIRRGPDNLTVEVHTAKPGVIIGRAGAGVEELKRQILLLLDAAVKLKVDIHEVKIGELFASVVAQNIAHQLEKRINYRRAVKQAIERTMGRGAKGIRVSIAGRLNGAEIARSEKFSAGTVPLSTFRADIDYAQIDANTTFGQIGVKVWIYKGEKTKIEE